MCGTFLEPLALKTRARKKRQNKSQKPTCVPVMKAAGRTAARMTAAAASSLLTATVASTFCSG